MSNNKKRVLRIVLQVGSYLLVAVLAAGIGTLIAKNSFEKSQSGNAVKLQKLEALIDECYIGEVDENALGDGAAAGMVAALGDRWSYYIPASQYGAYKEQMQNAYVGIGVTVSGEDLSKGLSITKVEPNGGARQAGILPGDIITHVEGELVAELGMDAAREKIKGEKGTTVQLTILRGEEQLAFTVARQLIETEVARGEMLDGKIGLVTIHNFDERCADETLAAVKRLVDEGATSLIFDVRNNPGGYKKELVKILDYLLPEGALFRSVLYNGEETVDESDASCLKLPMAVLVNAESYSAAEFFAAALSEYEWATVVGEHTVGKSYFQNTFELGDGSAVGLSVGKYCTPKGVTLAEVGGLKPDVEVEVDDETFAKIYGDLLEPMEDPQILAAIETLK